MYYINLVHAEKGLSSEFKVVLCQGADAPSVKLAIVEAVRCVTGLGADQISVQKMN